MELLLQQIINGLGSGSQYALWGAAYGIVYAVLGLMHFAYGDTLIVGGLTSFTLVMAGLPFPIAVLIAMLIAAPIAVAIEKLCYTPLMKRNHAMLAFVAALAVAGILRNIATLIWGTDTKVFPALVQTRMIQLGDLNINVLPLATLAISIVLVLLFQRFLDRTRTGRSIQAVAQDREIAPAMGINVGFITAAVYALSAVIGVLGLALYVANTRVLDVGLGFTITLKSFLVVIIGGMGSIRGAVAAGLMIGVVESLVSSYVSSRLVDAIVFSLLVGLLLLRPQGLFGRYTQMRA